MKINFNLQRLTNNFLCDILMAFFLLMQFMMSSEIGENDDTWQKLMTITSDLDLLSNWARYYF